MAGGRLPRRRRGGANSCCCVPQRTAARSPAFCAHGIKITGPRVSVGADGAEHGRGARGIRWPGLSSMLLAQSDRWFLWAPVAMAVGIGWYFALGEEPPIWTGPAAFVGALVLFAVARRQARGLLAPLAGAVLMTAAGFALASMQTARVEAPAIEKRTRPVQVIGRVVEHERHGKAVRLTLDRLDIARLDRDQTPERVRLTIRTGGAAGLPGDRVSMTAIVTPPPPPSAPGDFDFARHAFFDRIGGFGYALSPVRDEGEAEAGPVEALGFALDRLRLRLAARIEATLSGDSGATASALLTGLRGAMDRDVVDRLRDAGLAHLLAISGLHLGLVAGFVFYVVRLGLALVPRIALDYPIKKYAAVAALVAAAAYLALTGATVPTRRAFIMVAVVLAAILADRVALSMRLVAIAAMIVLATDPSSLLGPSFQMSFAAVVALVAVYEGPAGRWVHGGRGGLGGRAVAYGAGVLLTTAVAGLATAPVAAFHFNRLAAFGLAANMVAVPVVALWVMPAGLLALVLMPLGLDAWPLQAMGAGIDIVLEVARTVAAWPGAARSVAAMPVASLVLFAIAGLWVALWRGRVRLGGLAPAVLGATLAVLHTPPDIIVHGDAEVVAARLADGGLALSTRRRERFDTAIWLARNGQDAASPWPALGGSADGRLRCDDWACIYRMGGQSAAIVFDPAALGEDCERADLLVSFTPVRGRCARPARVIDLFDLLREGTTAIRLGRDGVTVETVTDGRGVRPWTGRVER